MFDSLRLLSLLKKNQIFSGESLAVRLKISRQALHKHIQILRNKGYGIEGKPKRGYTLVCSPERLAPEMVLSGLDTQWIGRRIFHLDRVDSTQNQARELAEKGERDGALVLADRQTAGRGRRGRSWISEPGGIWGTLLLRPQIFPHRVPLLSLLGSVAFSNAIEETLGLETRSKWPNDIMVRVPGQPSGKSRRKSEWKKVGGILVEMSAESERVQWVLLGFGVNVDNRIPVFLRKQATSLNQLSGSKIDRTVLLRKLLEQFEEHYSRFLKEGFDFNLYKNHSIFRSGERMMISDSKRETAGKFVKVDSEGALVMLTDRHQIEKFHAGDVSLLPM